MTTPSVIEVDTSTQQALSPLVDYHIDHKKDRRSQKSSSKKNDYKDMKHKYEEAKRKMDRLKNDCAQNRRMLLEMSSVINCLKDIAVDYEADDVANDPVYNIQRKVQAIDGQLKGAMLQCSNLEQEKELQSSTIRAQENQIKSMEEQMNLLQSQLKDVVDEENAKSIASEKETLSKMNRNGEGVGIIQAQEKKIAMLEQQVRKYSAERSKKMDQQIQAFRGAHQSKYEEIFAMESHLEKLRQAQTSRLSDVFVKEKTLPHKKVQFSSDAVQLKVDRKKNQSWDNSSTSTSSGSCSKPSLESISDDSVSRTLSYDEELFEDDKGASYSSRSQTSDTEQKGTEIKKSASDNKYEIKISASSVSTYDESVEIVVNQKHGNDVSDVSLSTEETATSRTHEVEHLERYNKAVVKIMELERENKRLRENHTNALSDMAQISDLTSSAQQTKKDYDTLKKKVEKQNEAVMITNANLANLKKQHGKTMDELTEERAKYAQLMNDYSRLMNREQEVRNYDQLKKMYDVVVMKVAEMGEESDRLVRENNEAQMRRDEAESKARMLLTETNATNSAYSELQEQNDTLLSKVNELSIKCDEFKTKYYELLACEQNTHEGSTHSRDERYEMLRQEYELILEKLRSLESKSPNIERLQRENAEAMTKIEILSKSKEELEDVREKLSSAKSKITELERENEKVEENLEKAMKQDCQRAQHLKDMLGHYKTLEAQYEEVYQKSKRLQAIIRSKDKAVDTKVVLASEVSSKGLGEETNGGALEKRLQDYEERITGLQKQRDAAVDQMKRLEEEISQARLEKLEAIECRKDREQDLKTVLKHFRELQEKYDDMQKQVVRLEGELTTEQTQHTVQTEAAVLADKEPECEPSEIVDETALHAAANMAKNNVHVVANSDKTANLTSNASIASSIEKTPATPINMLDSIQDADQKEGSDNSVTNLMIDMESLKRQQEERRKEQLIAKEEAGQLSEMSSVSNVTEHSKSVNDADQVSTSGISVLSDEAPSTSWKDIKISKLESQLNHQNATVMELEEKEKCARSDMEKMKQKLFVATLEATEAQNKQHTREGNLRDAIAQQKRLEKEHGHMKREVAHLESLLEKAQTKARLAEEDTKAARRRATAYHNQLKKLQEKHEVAMKTIEDQERQIQILEQS